MALRLGHAAYRFVLTFLEPIMSKPIRQLLTLIVLSLAILVIKAYVPMPILWRGIEAHGLYRLLGIVQFVETGIFTWLLTVFFVRRYWRMKMILCVCLGMGCTLFNFGLMMLDARLQTFPDWIEAIILRRYGTALQIYILASLSIFLGLSLAWIILAKGSSLSDQTKITEDK